MPDDKRLHQNDNSSGFFDQVLQVVRLIPEGRVTSYGAIARYLGTARSSRMVGWALNGTRFSADHIPAHRVVNRKGVLTGRQHFETGVSMETQLQQEGVEVVDGQIVNFMEVFWDPTEELALDRE